MGIGFVGAGRMGLPMVKRLVDAGQEVRVLARSPEAAASISAHSGAAVAQTIPETVDGADVVVICVHTDEQVRELCVGQGILDLMTSGSVLIVHTTGSPATIREIAGLAEVRGILVVDAPVSGGPNDIAVGAITVFVGGDERAVALATTTMSAYAHPIRHVGDLGAGQLMKLVNNSVFLSNIEIIAAAIKFGNTLGLAESAMIDCLRDGSANSSALGGIAAAGGAEVFRSAVAEFLNKDIDVVLKVAADTDVDLGAIGPLLTDSGVIPGALAP